MDSISSSTATPKWAGDINLVVSKAQTISSGDINLMIPGGDINVPIPEGPQSTGTSGVALPPGNQTLYIDDPVTADSEFSTLEQDNSTTIAEPEDHSSTERMVPVFTIPPQPTATPGNQTLLVPTIHAPEDSSGGLSTGTSDNSTTIRYSLDLDRGFNLSDVDPACFDSPDSPINGA